MFFQILCELQVDSTIISAAHSYQHHRFRVLLSDLRCLILTDSIRLVLFTETNTQTNTSFVFPGCWSLTHSLPTLHIHVAHLGVRQRSITRVWCCSFLHLSPLVRFFEHLFRILLLIHNNTVRQDSQTAQEVTNTRGHWGKIPPDEHETNQVHGDLDIPLGKHKWVAVW